MDDAAIPLPISVETILPSHCDVVVVSSRKKEVKEEERIKLSF
jgi:hypothetical protein